MTKYLHGVEVIEIDTGARPLRTVKTSVIGVVGTALTGPIDAPTLIHSLRDGRARFGSAGGTLPDALAAIYAQVGAAVVAVNVYDPAIHTTAVAAAAYALLGDEAMLPHRAVSAVAVTSADGTTTYTADTDYTVDAEAGTVTRIASGGIAADAELQIAYEYPDIAAVPAAAVVGGVNVATGAYEGASALLGAESVVGVAPKILIAPGYTPNKTEADALIAVADRLRGIAIIEGPDTADAAAIAHRGQFSSRRAYAVDPGVQIVDEAGETVTRAVSAYVAGVIAKSDHERGFWWSPSNHPISGIVGTTRPVDFALGDANARANRLNENEVATVIQLGGEFRLWGNRTCSDDEKWAFLSVVRTADAINDSLVRAHQWAVDRNITGTYLEDVAEGVNAYLRDLVGLGAILGGRCEPSPELNTAESIQAGKVSFDFDFTPPSPAERITFRSRLVNDYIEDILS